MYDSVVIQIHQLSTKYYEIWYVLYSVIQTIWFSMFYKEKMVEIIK